MNPLHHMIAGGGLGKVTVSGGSVSDDDFSAGSSVAICGFRWNTDGTVDKLEGASYTQVSASTDWVQPNAKSNRRYWIHATQVSYNEVQETPSIFETLDGTMDTWLELTTAREWKNTLNSNSAGAGDNSWVITVSIASDSAGTNVLDSANYTMTNTVL